MRDSSLRVLLVTAHLPESEKSCAPQHVLHEIRYLSKIKNIELMVASSNPVDYEIPGVKFVRFPNRQVRPNLYNYLNFILKAFPNLPLSYRRWVWKYWWQGILENVWIANLIHEYKIDIIHSHWFFPRCTGAIYAGHVGDVPVVLTARGSDIIKDESIGFGWRLAPHRNRLIMSALAKANVVTVASKASMDAVQEIIGKSDKVHYIPNGVDLDLFNFEINDNGLRSRLLDGSSFLILSVGGLKRLKGHDVLIRSVWMLREKGLSVKLVIVGEGSEYNNLSNLIKELSLQDTVELLGGRVFQELPKYFAACDCFALASSKEGFGNVFLEALAMKRPLVTTPVGFVNDFLIDRDQARIIPFRDPESMADALYDVLMDPESSRAMARCGYDLVRSKFTIEARTEAFHNLYTKLVLPS